MSRFRTGFGYDVHQLVPDRPLILGSIQIPFLKGALGHSDADVLLHAIADALLGAAALGDLGAHFPDTDTKLQGIESTVILKQVNKLISDQGYHISNIDSTVVLQEPKISNYIPEMRAAIAAILDLELNQVSVKATSTEQLGAIGRGEGIAAYASVLIYS
jgi:2-C-methyl-D-erythritol 2,4-cyclodiphosphate synthase